MRTVRVATLLFIGLFSPLAHSADIGWANDAGRKDRLYLTINGEIRPGDAAKLNREAEKSRWNFILATGLIVDSQGGSVSEALKIAQMVESAGLTVHVDDDGQCASSCFFIYVSAPDRGTYTGSVLVHRPYFDMSGLKGTEGPSYERAYRDAFAQSRQFLSDRLVPNHIIDAMMSKGSYEGYRLTRHDLDSIGPFSPAIREYMFQVCGIPTDDIITEQEIKGLNKCELRYLRETRFKYLFGLDHERAIAQWDRLDGLLSTLSSNGSKPEEFKRAFAAATQSVNNDPPSLWVEKTITAYTTVPKR